MPVPSGQPGQIEAPLAEKRPIGLQHKERPAKTNDVRRTETTTAAQEAAQGVLGTQTQDHGNNSRMQLRQAARNGKQMTQAAAVRITNQQRAVN
jgi:hypothetical protein